MKRKIDNGKSEKAISSLNALYSKIPATTGCMENLSICKGKCCQIQNPQVLYCEFLNSWKYVVREWDIPKIIKLIENALRNYMSNNLAKGCIFFDKGKYTCEIHDVRNYNCRLYTQIPDEEFKPRYEALKVLYRKQFQPIMDQCKVPKSSTQFPPSEARLKSGQKVYTSNTTSWWSELKGIEQEMGIDEKFINDDFDGTYRSYHDHLLEYILPENILGDLSQVRENSTQEDKELTVVSILAKIENMFNKAISKK